MSHRRDQLGESWSDAVMSLYGASCFPAVQWLQHTVLSESQCPQFMSYAHVGALRHN